MIPLTKVEGVPDRSEVINGMAFFANTGPESTTCGTCKLRGYFRMSKFGRSYFTTACAKFKSLTGKYGPRLKKDTPSCKYYDKK